MVMIVMFFGLGASTLVTNKIPYYTSIIMTFIYIVIVAFANVWSYHMILSIYKKKEDNDKSFKSLGKIIESIEILLLMHSLGEIIIHQILFYRSLCGIFNIIGGYDYEIMDEFISESDFSKYKFLITISSMFFIIIPLFFLQFFTNDKTSLLSSERGVYTIIFIALAILVQCPFYLASFFEDGHKIEDINFYSNKNKGVLKYFQILGIIFFCFSGHNGMIQVIKQGKEEEKIKKVYKYSNLWNSIIYIAISITGYLSIPTNIVNNITERKIFWSKDVIMTISRIMLLPFSINKILNNFNLIKDKIFACVNKKTNKILISIIIIIFPVITTIISSFFQNIDIYVTLLGGLITIPTFFIPSFVYIKLNPKYKIIILLIGIILFLLGLLSFILELLEISGIKIIV